MFAIDGFMGVQGLTINCAFILENMEKWTYIGIRVIFAFETYCCDEIALVISIS